MNEPIKVSFQWSIKEMRHAHGLHMRYSKQGRKLRLVYIGVGLMFAFLGFAQLFLKKVDFLTGSLPFFVLSAFVFCWPLFVQRAVRKMYAQKPDRDQSVSYEIFPDRIASRSEVASGDMQWRAIIRAHKMPDGFLLYPSERMFHWLPKHGFADPADIERLAQLAKANVPQYEETV